MNKSISRSKVFKRADYLKAKRMIDIKQLPENAHLAKSLDKEYSRRYCKEYHKRYRLDTPSIPITVKNTKIILSFD